jgi:hypothetical protein
MNIESFMKKFILVNHPELTAEDLSTEDAIEAKWTELTAADEIYDLRNEARWNGEQCNLRAWAHYSWARHYDVCVYATKFEDKYIAWNFMSGGGKFGEPESYEWWLEAKYVDCVEEPVTIIQRTFSFKAEDEL